MTSGSQAALEAFAYIALFIYVFWFRVHGLDEGFVLMGDQIRDWDVARRRFTDLPLGGVPSSAGGATLGPAFYWILWLIAHTVGPLVDNLPHAGGIGISLLQSQGDVVLAWALVRRLGSVPLALAIVLLSATSVFDAVVSSTIWNPPVAVALLKFASALVLMQARPSMLATASIAALSWAAVHAHTSAIFVTGPMLAWLLGRSWWKEVYRRAIAETLIVTAVIGALQAPWLIHSLSVGVQGQTDISNSVTAVLQAPLAVLRPAASVTAVTGHLGDLLFLPIAHGWFPWLLACGTTATLLLVRDVRVAIVSGLPVITAALALMLWQGTYERYWLLVLGPAAAMALLGWIGSLSDPWRVSVAFSVLLAVVLLQPPRFEGVRTTGTYPGYGALVRGCRAIAADGRPVATIRTTGFPEPIGGPLWLCSLLNVSVAPDVTTVATIDAAGRVWFAASHER